MKTTIKILLIAAAGLLLTGVIAAGIAIVVADFDFENLFYAGYETNTYEITGAFEKIELDVETASVRFILSEEENCKVVCYDRKNAKHSAANEDGTLTVKMSETQKWYEHIMISFGSPKITIYLPEKEYSSLVVETTTGSIEISDDFSFENVKMTGTTANISCYAEVTKSVALHTTTGNIELRSGNVETVSLSATTGSVTVKGVSCDDLTATCSTGEIQLTDIAAKGSIKLENTTGRIRLTNTTAEEFMKLKNTTGGVRLQGCDAGEITIKTRTGSVKGSLLTEKIFITETSTGKVSVPKTATGGRCEITTSTGDIDIEIG